MTESIFLTLNVAQKQTITSVKCKAMFVVIKNAKFEFICK